MSVEVCQEEGIDTEIQAIVVEEGLVVLRIIVATLKVAVAVEALAESEIPKRIEEVNLEVEVEREVAKGVLAAEERLLAEALVKAVVEVQVEV